jgi:hypothetical protein
VSFSWICHELTEFGDMERDVQSALDHGPDEFTYDLSVVHGIVCTELFLEFRHSITETSDKAILPK